jgi:hypothetical protein
VKVLEEIKNITDPADPRRPAFSYDTRDV